MIPGSYISVSDMSVHGWYRTVVFRRESGPTDRCICCRRIAVIRGGGGGLSTSFDDREVRGRSRNIMAGEFGID